jgi:hypothetical protein
MSKIKSFESWAGDKNCGDCPNIACGSIKSMECAWNACEAQYLELIKEKDEEIVKRNQYKINQEYLDNTHKHYENEITELKAQIELKDKNLIEIENLLKKINCDLILTKAHRRE